MTTIRKYRGKNIKTGEWLYGMLNCGINDTAGKWYIAQYGLYSNIEVDPGTIGQSTGSSSKNKTEVYEGDILENDGEWYIVMWDEDNLQWEASGAGEDTESIALCEIVNEAWVRNEIPEE